MLILFLTILKSCNWGLQRKLEEMMIAGHGEENEEGEANEDAKDEETKADASTSGNFS